MLGSNPTMRTKSGRRVPRRLAGDQKVVGLNVEVVDALRLEHLRAVGPGRPNVTGGETRDGRLGRPSVTWRLRGDYVAVTWLGPPSDSRPPPPAAGVSLAAPIQAARVLTAPLRELATFGNSLGLVTR